MKNINRFLLLLSVITLLLVIPGGSPAFSQTSAEPSSLQNVHLWINPEYDDPRLLVMLEGQIVGVEAPAKVRFLVPSAAEMYSAGSKDAQGKYSGGPPARQASVVPGWDEISYNVTTNIFRVEYYDPGITGLTDKSITYKFLRLYPISNLNVIIQQPRLATNFKVIPAGQAYTDSEGFNTSVYSYPDLAVDTPVSFQISYTKSDPRPSLDIKDTGSSSPLAAVIAILALVVIIIGIFVWRRTSRTNHRAARQRGRNNAPPEPSTRQPKNRFCTRCGKPVAGSDKFCPHCGAKLS